MKEYSLVWPDPPDTPRIAYVGTLRGENDFSTGLGGALNALAGKKSEIVFQRPFDVCFGEEGTLYVTDAMQGIIRYDSKQRQVTPIGENIETDLRDPRGIAYAHGRLYVGLSRIGQILVINNEGRTVGKIGRQNQLTNPVDIVIDTNRSRIYVVESHLHQVLVYSEKGDSLFAIGSRGAGDGQFNYPLSAAIDSKGMLYVVDGLNYRVEVFDTNGTYIRQFGKQGDAFGTFARPKGIALDSFDNIYVLDAVHQNFQVFNNDGQLLMFVGRSSSKNDGFQNPISIAIDAKDRLYITDNLNSRIQVFQLLQQRVAK